MLKIPKVEKNSNKLINLKPQTDYEICLRNIDNLECLFQEKQKIRNLGSYLDLPVELKNGKFVYEFLPEDEIIKENYSIWNGHVSNQHSKKLTNSRLMINF